MKHIVETDNFGSDYPDEKFIFVALTDQGAEELCACINKHKSGPNSNRYWKVVDIDYVLQPGFEP